MIDFQNIYPEIFLMLVMLSLLIAGVFVKNLERVSMNLIEL